MRTLRWLGPLCALSASTACGDGGDALDPPPSGGADTGLLDGSTADAGPSDAALSDAGVSDLGADDGGSDAAVDVGVDAGTTCPNEGVAAPEIVATTEGPVRGEMTSSGWRYMGIPFAAPPTGALRFAAPTAPTCRSEILDARAAASECPQYSTEEGRPLIGNEDCLYLNVWAPTSTATRPVMVFIHGGAHEQGSGTKAAYEATGLAAEDVVVVTFNYRVGPFGFLAHPGLEGPSGNYGMADQIHALKWVRDNISNFGGDPERVMIFGQSAGAVSTCRLLVSPAARGLFHSAAMLSGACVATPQAAAETSGQTFVDNVGCSGSDPLGCLRGLSMEAVMAGFEPATTGTNVSGRLSFDGVVDGDLVPDAPRTLIEAGSAAPVPVIVGSTREENGRDAPAIASEAAYRAAVELFVPNALPNAVVEQILALYPTSAYASPRAAYVALTSDVRFTCQARRDARLLGADPRAPAYRYLFAEVPEDASVLLQRLGAWHGIDLPYVFGTFGTTNLTPTARDEAAIAAYRGIFTSLARGEVPPNMAAPSPSETRLTLFEEGRAEVVADPKATECEFWDQFVQ